MGIDDPYVAWTFNNAVHLFGSSLQGELDAVEEGRNANNKRNLIFNKWMRVGGKSSGMFRDPAAGR
jgi:hypothetical protein